jgi:nucleotide-binding universal stress UspA family protein
MPAAKVVVGVSGSVAGLAALRFGVAEAGRRAVPLYAIRAWPFLRQWRGVSPVSLQRELAAEARRCIDEAFDAAMGGRPTDVEVLSAAPCGRTDLVLTDVADGGHDLLVIGGRTGRRLGWIVRGCARNARCPVVVVPPPELARAAGGPLSVRHLLREARRHSSGQSNAIDAR